MADILANMVANNTVVSSTVDSILEASTKAVTRTRTKTKTRTTNWSSLPKRVSQDCSRNLVAVLLCRYVCTWMPDGLCLARGMIPEPSERRFEIVHI